MPAEQHPDLARVAAAPRSLLADAAGYVADPAVMVSAVLLVIAVENTGSIGAGVGWTVVAAGFCVGVPYLLLHVLVRRGAVTDRHVAIREQRRAPLAAGVASVAVGIAVLRALGAPAPVTALVVAMLAGLGSMAMISLAYKASFHVAIAGGVAVILASALGVAWGLAMVPAVAMVAWARVRPGRHTAGQAAVGLIVGCTVAGVVYPMLTA